MALSEDEWRRVTQPTQADQLALGVVQAGLPVAWTHLSPHELMSGAAVIALHYDRRRMAEALRSRVLKQHTELPPQIKDMPPEVEEAFKWVAGRIELMLFELADQIEQGQVGLAN